MGAVSMACSRYEEVKNSSENSAYASEPSRCLLQSLREKSLRDETNAFSSGTAQPHARAKKRTPCSYGGGEHLEAGGVDEAEGGDGDPGGPAGGLPPAARGGEGDEQRAGGEEAERGDEEGARLGYDPLHRHHGRAPEEEGRHQRRPLPPLPPHERRRRGRDAILLLLGDPREEGLRAYACACAWAVDEALDVRAHADAVDRVLRGGRRRRLAADGPHFRAWAVVDVALDVGARADAVDRVHRVRRRVAARGMSHATAARARTGRLGASCNREEGGGRTSTWRDAAAAGHISLAGALRTGDEAAAGGRCSTSAAAAARDGGERGEGEWRGCGRVEGRGSFARATCLSFTHFFPLSSSGLWETDSPKKITSS